MNDQGGTNYGQVAIGVAILGSVYLVSEMLDQDEDQKPGGDVKPAPGDTRPATFTELFADTLADQIEEQVYGGGLIIRPWEYDAQFAGSLMLCRVTADVALLMNAYGARGGWASEINLAATVTAYLDREYVDVVNADYREKGILLQWV